MAIAGAFFLPHPPIIFPEIGKGEEIKITDTIHAYREAAGQIGALQPETIVIISPHATMYRDYFHISPGTCAEGDFSRFGCPDIKLKADYDTELASQIEYMAMQRRLPAGCEGERNRLLDHGTMIPLRFLGAACKKQYKIVRIGLSGLPLTEHYHLGQCIKEASEALERRIVIIASGDLSHRLSQEGPYGYTKQGPEYDRQITELFKTGALEKALDFSDDFREQAGECGHGSISILAGCLKGLPLISELLSYEGPFGVGYAVAVFSDAYTALAGKALAYYVKHGKKMPLPESLPKELYEKQAGAFVSLKKEGGLRGCIGTIQAVQSSLAEEIIENTISACAYDPRFRPVVKEELEDIICTVDVLSDAEPVYDLKELDVKKYGIIITEGRKRGLLLPNLEGVDTIEEQIAITLSKAGIREEAFVNGNCSIERFEVVRHY